MLSEPLQIIRANLAERAKQRFFSKDIDVSEALRGLEIINAYESLLLHQRIMALELRCRTAKRPEFLERLKRESEIRARTRALNIKR